MTAHIISATEANRSFSEILNKVYYQGQTFEVKRGREIIAKISPCSATFKHTIKVKDLNEFFKNLPKLDKKNSEEFEQVIKALRKKKKIERNKWD